VEQASFGPYKSIIAWFASSNTVDTDDEAPRDALARALTRVEGLEALTRDQFAIRDETLELPAAMEFVLEGLHQSRLLARDEVDGGTRYGDMLGSMFKDLDLGGEGASGKSRA
jgi:hypothetical protein